MDDLLSKLKDQYKRNLDQSTAIIYVTHGINVQSFVFHAEKCSPLSDVTIHSYINLCGIGAFSLQGKSSRMVHGGSIEHLQD